MEDLKRFGISYGGSTFAGGGIEATVDVPLAKDRYGSPKGSGFTITYGGGEFVGAFIEGTYTVMTNKLSWKKIGQIIHNQLPKSKAGKISPNEISNHVFEGFKSKAINKIDDKISEIQSDISGLKYSNKTLKIIDEINRERGIKDYPMQSPKGKINFNNRKIVDLKSELEKQKSNKRELKKMRFE